MLKESSYRHRSLHTPSRVLYVDSKDSSNIRRFQKSINKNRETTRSMYSGDCSGRLSNDIMPDMYKCNSNSQKTQSAFPLQIERMRNLCHYIDLHSDDVRNRVWNEFLNVLTSELQENAKEPSKRYAAIAKHQYFTPVLELWLKESEIHKPYIERLYKVMLHMTASNPSLFKPNELIQSQKSKVCLTRKNLGFKRPKATGLASEKPRVELNSAVYISGPTPFSTHFLGNLQQLRLLQQWAPTLDKLAPSYKTLLWRVCKLFDNEFGDQYDLSSFRKTVGFWTKDPMIHGRAINLLFSAIGYLKEKDVLKHEFFYPSTLVPVFKSSEHSDKPKRRRKRKRRSQPEHAEPTPENPVHIKPLVVEVSGRPRLCSKLRSSQFSAFKDYRNALARKTDINLRHNRHKPYFPRLVNAPKDIMHKYPNSMNHSMSYTNHTSTQQYYPRQQGRVYMQKTRPMYMTPYGHPEESYGSPTPPTKKMRFSLDKKYSSQGKQGFSGAYAAQTSTKNFTNTKSMKLAHILCH